MGIGMGIGSHGPLIELSAACCHVGELVQLIVFVHCSTPVQGKTPASPNWKVHKQEKPRDCLLLSQVLALSAPCKAVFHASIGEVLLQSLPLVLEKERRFLSRRLVTKTDIIVEDMISTGCQLCGLPLCSDSTSVGKDSPLYCGKSSNRLHIVGFIYRPFMLYVWDKSEYIPLLVTNKAAELLFGNITAEKVYLSYKDDQKDPQKLKNPVKAHVNVQDSVKVEEKRIESSPSVGAMGLETRRNYNDSRSRNFYLIWLIVLKMLLLQGKNSLLKFEAHVNPSLEPEDGRFQMITVSMPCSNYKKSSDI